MDSITQLELFEVTPAPKEQRNKPRYYKDLSIHEKINVKGNTQSPFAKIFLLNGRKGWSEISPIRRDDHPEEQRISPNYYLNHGSRKVKYQKPIKAEPLKYNHI